MSPDEYTTTSGPVKCSHEWELRNNDGHVREYVCVKCGKNHYQEAAADGR